MSDPKTRDELNARLERVIARLRAFDLPRVESEAMWKRRRAALAREATELVELLSSDDPRTVALREKIRELAADIEAEAKKQDGGPS